MKPYYQSEGVTIYHGDAREILPTLYADTIITDPVWPNASADLIGSDRPYELFAEVAAWFPVVAARAVIQLGVDSDPRFLFGVPAAMPFFRVCWLEYACPTHKGRVLYSGDVAYVFGRPPKSAHGRRVISGRYVSTKPDTIRVRITKQKDWGRAAEHGLHPTPRRVQHVRWLVSKFADGVVLDPFCGSGTTLLAAKCAHVPAIGIEIVEQYCEIAAKRLAQMTLNFVGAQDEAS